ncbi:MAG: hypothetical protein IJO33_01340 [Bacilli bacterium]|nr:hypothetical protein [Bacilli bacterium]
MRSFGPTIIDFKNLGLTDSQIDNLVTYENSRHGFQNSLKSDSYSFSEPQCLFFLDIKDTLYHCKGHGGSGVLGRPGDAAPIYMRDIMALGRLLSNCQGGQLNMDNYSLGDGAYIRYNFPEDKENAKYKLDLPTSSFRPAFSNVEVRYNTNKGPYKTIFVSSDPIEVQRNIILFFLIIYEIMYNNKFLSNNEIIELSELFEKCSCDYDSFVENIPDKYKVAFKFCYDDVKNNIFKKLNNASFLTTNNSSLNKAQLMESFLDNYNEENGLSYDDYNIFACGDNYSVDGPMIETAFKLGGYGCLNSPGFAVYCESETLRKEIYLKYGIDVQGSILSFGFADFYNKAMDMNSYQRTWHLAETMYDVNSHKQEVILNRFKKTNHYIEVKRK